MPKLKPNVNHYGRDISGSIPPTLTGAFVMTPELGRVWERAAVLLRVRDNDSHTLYAFGLATALLDLYPNADAAVVLPAILLHDIGWSQVDPSEVLSAIAPGAGRPDLVLVHEREGARLAADILATTEYDPGRIDRIVEIIDGHDSRTNALSIEDAIVKDADKTWRLTPHGIDTVMDWFGLDRAQALSLCSSRVRPHLFTDGARTMAETLIALESVTLSPQLRALFEPDPDRPGSALARE
jgi:hypothetical protein